LAIYPPSLPRRKEETAREEGRVHGKGKGGKGSERE